MKIFLSAALLVSTMSLPAQRAPGSSGQELLGSVHFKTSCAAPQAAALDRGVALLHDFWYEEAKAQFAAIQKADPGCSMAYWGEAMSDFQQIWDRADEATRAKGWAELQKADAHPAATPRERAYLAALTMYYKPDKRAYQTRIEQYSDAMGKLYAQYPDDVDAGAFYALSILATTPPDDTSLKTNRAAVAVLRPLFAEAPDNPGVDHYIIHACDTPELAREGLPAAEHYGPIAASAPHAIHMPGHIFARLGMWQEDIDANEASVHAAEAAEARHLNGARYMLHSDDFLLYAYLQTGQDAKARAASESTGPFMAGGMGPSMGGMKGMLPYYQTELPIIYELELRDWKTLAAATPVADASGDVQAYTYWARTIADGHLLKGADALAAEKHFDEQVERIRKGARPEDASSTDVQIRRGEVQAWAAFASGRNEDALAALKRTADLQDKVGQGEVDIPAREMLADMLLELHRPQEALVMYDRSLALSPNRFNGLYHAGLAAEATGDTARAARYYAILLKQTGGPARSDRPELAHASTVAGAAQVAAR